MPTILKHWDKWQAQIRLKGIKPIAKSFSKKSDAVAWSRATDSRVTLGTYVDPRVAESAFGITEVYAPPYINKFRLFEFRASGCSKAIFKVWQGPSSERFLSLFQRQPSDLLAYSRYSWQILIRLNCIGLSVLRIAYPARNSLMKSLNR